MTEFYTEELLDSLTVGKGTKWEATVRPRFIEKQKAWDNRWLLVSLYETKVELYKRMEAEGDRNTLKALATSVERNEFNIQQAFNFEPSINYHRFWEVPQCTCPSMDNDERIGTDYKIIIGDCKVHGGTEDE